MMVAHNAIKRSKRPVHGRLDRLMDDGRAGMVLATIAAMMR